MEHLIKGEMVCAEVIGNDNDMHSMIDYTEHIKKDLIQKLVEHLYRANHIEFTQIPDHRNNQTKYRARIFTTPDDQVRIIRKLGLDTI